ncbi:molybdopterin molybdotransferase [Oscillibacter sp. PC13]|uniref:molybdopterin molybdotransferase MoeA n=1 Tax=Oscillibacter sp. PC13 TaxID=1855299 RepID=UPI0008E51379|nr:gephyrin-like molybdotransferase Glp [Oscillibacter sp. PC13]SFP63807.1 molybdopterin molybdotransferase [Oscillibacter sp. PC13]
MAISVEQAIDLVLQYTHLLEEEEVPLLDAVGRILTRDVRAAIVQPPFDRSPLDGYAVRAEDLVGASREAPAVLQVVDKLYAGDVSGVPVCAGQAVRLMTGSMIPSGADCIIRQEDTDEDESLVHIFKSARSGENYCHRGEEYQMGACLISAGRKVDAAAVAVAAGSGLTSLYVRRRMRVAVISTGDEVWQPGTPLPPGKIYDSNTSYLVARLHQLGAEITAVDAIGDDLEQMTATLRRCSADADLILTTGGVSVGQKDLAEAAMVAFGARVVFHGIDVKPGMPTLFAEKNGLLLLGLSGNPFSAAVPFELLLRPMLAKMTQDASIAPRRETVRAANMFSKSSRVRRFLRAHSRDGQVFMPTEQSNGQMRSMIGCNCLIDVPAGSSEIPEGTQVEIIWL